VSSQFKTRDTSFAAAALALALVLTGCHKSNNAGAADTGRGPGLGGDGGPNGPDGGIPGLPDATGCGLRTCQSAQATCGAIGDGCGGALYCGDCTAPQSCGGGRVPNQCGGTHGCQKRTCAEVGATCGPVSDGCGGLLMCGACNAPQTCGGGGLPNVCGGNGGGGDAGVTMCVPRTCASAMANCGPIGDGCGGSLQCGSCVAPNICGGGGTPSVCGGGNADAGTQCTNLCQRQVSCDGGTTSISGTVFAPTPPQFGNPDPLYNALVYVPNGAVEAFTPGVACERCGTPASGAPLVNAMTGPDGRFTLLNAPSGANVPLVIQLGRWRRQVTIPNVNACQDNPLPPELTRLPRNKMEGDIPLMAMVTGKVDTLECVLQKIGIEDSEFTLPQDNGGSGRVQFYVANGSDLGGGTPADQDLWSSPQRLAEYDLVLLACEGAQNDKQTTPKQNIVNYSNVGGRVFATHYSYVWLYDIPPFNMTGTWNVDTHTQHPPGDPTTGIIDTSFPKGMAFAQWVNAVGAGAGQDRITINVSRHDLDMPITPPAQRFVYTDPSAMCNGTPCPSTVQHYAFNTPWGQPPDQQCGRVIFSDFHVNNIQSSTGISYPDECTPGPMTAQEKILEFMLFDLASCIAPDNPNQGAMCTARTCAQQHANCGPVADGCGNLLQCGDCPMGQMCGGAGPSICGGPGMGTMCTPETCAAQGLHCGPAGDGCGNTMDCGACPDGTTCGGGGMQGICGMSECMATTCAMVMANCGLIGDGCGGTLDCGICHAPETCGGRGTPNVCGTPF
jgi:hypothetical protein